MSYHSAIDCNGEKPHRMSQELWEIIQENIIRAGSCVFAVVTSERVVTEQTVDGPKRKHGFCQLKVNQIDYEKSIPFTYACTAENHLAEMMNKLMNTYHAKVMLAKACYVEVK